MARAVSQARAEERAAAERRAAESLALASRGAEGEAARLAAGAADLQKLHEKAVADAAAERAGREAAEAARASAEAKLEEVKAQVEEMTAKRSSRALGFCSTKENASGVYF